MNSINCPPSMTAQVLLELLVVPNVAVLAPALQDTNAVSDPSYTSLASQ